MVEKSSGKAAGDVQPDEVEGQEPRALSRLERQVRFFKGFTAFLFIVVIGMVGAFLYIRHVNRPVQIVIDGKTIATAKNYTAAVALLGGAERDAVGDGYPADAFVRLQNVEFVRTSSDAAIDSDETIRHLLSTNLKLKVRAYVIEVDGHPTIGLPSSQAATQTLNLVRNHYAALPPNDPIIGDPTFVERVVIDRVSIPAVDARHGADDAAAYFWSLPPARTYVVQQGDRGYNIAVKHHVPFADFLDANAGHDMNNLHPGDVVNLARSQPILSVDVKKQTSDTEAIIGGDDVSNAGKRRVVYAVTYTNGIESRRDILSMVTLSRPRPRMSL